MSDTTGEVLEWTEFRAARGIGLAEGTWLRTSERGYADLHRQPDPGAVTDGVRAIEPTLSLEPLQRCVRSPRQSSYVDLGSLPTR